MLWGDPWGGGLVDAGKRWGFQHSARRQITSQEREQRRQFDRLGKKFGASRLETFVGV